MVGRTWLRHQRAHGATPHGWPPRGRGDCLVRLSDSDAVAICAGRPVDLGISRRVRAESESQRVGGESWLRARENQDVVLLGLEVARVETLRRHFSRRHRRRLFRGGIVSARTVLVHIGAATALAVRHRISGDCRQSVVSVLPVDPRRSVDSGGSAFRTNMFRFNPDDGRCGRDPLPHAPRRTIEDTCACIGTAASTLDPRRRVVQETLRRAGRDFPCADHCGVVSQVPAVQIDAAEIGAAQRLVRRQDRDHHAVYGRSAGPPRLDHEAPDHDHAAAVLQRPRRARRISRFDAPRRNDRRLLARLAIGRGSRLMTADVALEDIVGAVPGWISRAASAHLLFLVFGLGALFWFVRYPEVVRAPIAITAETPPAPVYSRQAGQLKFWIKENADVSAAQILGEITGSADAASVIALRDAIRTGNALGRSDWGNLGELQADYSSLMEPVQQF